MDPAMPDWRAFGQATTAAPPEPARPEGRTDAAAAWVRRLPRTTLIALIATVVLAVGGVALALGTPTGGDITLSGDGTEGPAMGPMGATGAARSVVDGPAVPIATELVVDVAGGVARPGLVRLAGGAASATPSRPRVDTQRPPTWPQRRSRSTSRRQCTTARRCSCRSWARPRPRIPVRPPVTWPPVGASTSTQRQRRTSTPCRASAP